MPLKRDYLYGTAFTSIAAFLAINAARGGTYSLLIWPALSFTLVAWAYSTGNPRLFGKRADGKRNLIATAVLFPYLLFAYSVWLLQVSLSSKPSSNHVNEVLVLSRRLHGHELPPTVTQVCDLTCEFVEPKAIRQLKGYVCHPILDAGTADAAELVALAKSLPVSDAEVLLVHCANGYGRTGMFAAIWLLSHGYASSVEEAISLVQSARPGLSLRRRQRAAIVESWNALQSDDEQSHSPTGSPKDITD